MATNNLHLTHSPNFFLPCNNFFFAAAPPPHFRHLHHRTSLSGVSTSSTNNNTRVGSSRKPVRSNEDLCNDLREFMAQVGIPDGHVPSLKELTHHGRQDLANIVRRRGYKLITELLAASQEINVTDSDVEGSSTEDRVSNEEDELIGLHESGKELAGDVLLSSKDPIMEEASSTNTFEDYTNSDIESCFLVDESTKSSLHEKVAKFIQTGELETVEDSGLDVVTGKKLSESARSTEYELISDSEEPSSQVLSVSDSEDIANGSILAPYIVHSSSQLRNFSSNDEVENDESAFDDKDVEVEVITKEDKAEINRIKVMLHQKELELSQLKQQIEKNKQALSELQAKSETEISKAQKLLLEKDAELSAAEESLSGLKQEF
uniref:protein PTST homolog 3, chloroplastic isoform X2 n=1 Tax=Erigeron canadensis TaxID=72917 RepID=UPI001CB921F7|nr:protein PTST homolog 3, chloroplastic isoform X2 [Erigeron canadensis]